MKKDSKNREESDETIKRHKFYIPGQTDTVSQKTAQISESENLILKLYQKGTSIEDFSVKEIEEILNIDIEKEREKDRLNVKILLLCEATQKYIREHKKEIIKRIQQDKEEQR